MAEVYVGVKNWDEVNWYLQEGYFIGNPNGITFPGYFTLQFDLDDEEKVAALKKLVINARRRGIKITTDSDVALMKIGISIEQMDNPDVQSMLRVLSNGVAHEEPKEEHEEPKISKAGEALEERREQLRKCNAFFLAVANELKETHQIFGSALKVWGSACLIPKGTESQLNYYSKPINSLRVACNWNWRASIKRCHEEHYIQCNTPDLPWCRKRENDGMASKPIWGNMVGYFGDDHKYHCVYGEKFNRATKTWEWVEGDPKEVARMMLDKAIKMEAEKALQESMKANVPVTDEEADAAIEAEVQIDEI